MPDSVAQPFAFSRGHAAGPVILENRSVFAAGWIVNEFMEAADLPVRRAILVQERQVCGIELFEEIVPGDFFQLLVLGFEVGRRIPTSSSAAVPFTAAG